ncbi:MAG: ATP-binding cassette domain-containing protein [Methanobacterium sp.]|jgi:ABC-2 type transport system ATP-binding protein|uniref:ATP-binding cassette domain-containing protein n=1 Tax=Methanobacterium sp. TaxID=2164 RepID=UPI00258F6884|nr:ATP-binding cassette domain-containing protein [Methanobacterium sp.]MCC7560730.1 ATP-binding cassette domain-containing protein [Methanobacterium sp.]HOI39921.1 ATP-binding cassette domain-containing protein [Methanobacterium sp.]
MEYVVEVQNLNKGYKEIKAVDGVDFKVKKGEIFGFLGPNGAGKTTTVRMLTGIIKPDSGKAYILGYDIQKEPLKAKEHLGVVPETSNAYVDLSAWQNLILTSDLYGVPKKDAVKRANDLLKEFDLYGRKDDKVKGFSKGMKQRLILAMALINDPQLLFLDEPTSGLDVQSSILIRQMLIKLHEKGKTILLTTHNLEEANKLCERIAIINKGKIAAIDTPENLKKMIKKLNTIEVTFDGPVNIQELSQLPEIQDISKKGDKYSLNTENINNLILTLTEYSKSKNIKINSLNTLDPSLEEVFIELIERG